MNIQNLAFSGGTLNRLSESRNDAAVAEALSHRHAKFIVFSGQKPLLRFDHKTARCWHQSPVDLQLDFTRSILLGSDDSGAPWLAAPSFIDPAATGPEHLPQGVKAVDLRSIVAQGLLSGAELGNLAYAAALNSWHTNNRFCSKCGTASVLAAGGAKRLCPACTAEHFPRTDPVAIMMVTHENSCLLGRSPHFPAGMYSCLAGFIEAGETIEDAVRRETYEESGIQLGKVTYVASQPWPMPHSLMIGCFAEAISTTINFDTVELEACRWFSKEDLRAMIDGTHAEGLTPPLEGAIAGYLMRQWVAE